MQLNKDRLRQEKLDGMAQDIIPAEGLKLIDEAYRAVFEGNNARGDAADSNHTSFLGGNNCRRKYAGYL